jgi:hypothetical protein
MNLLERTILRRNSVMATETTMISVEGHTALNFTPAKTVFQQKWKVI